MILLFAFGLVILRIFYLVAEMCYERDWPRDTWKGLLTAFLLLGLCASAFGQASRVDVPIQTSGPNVPFSGGPLPQALWVSNSSVYLCNHSTALDVSLAWCQANPITTYTDSTEGTVCPAATQLVQLPGNTCTANSGTTANVGFWYAGGTIDYWVVSAYGTYGPFTVTVSNALGGPYAPLTGVGTSGTWPISITGNASLDLPLTGGTLSGLLNAQSLNGGIVFADQYGDCLTGTYDQTCINGAVAALPHGGTIVLKPGQVYNVNSCTADGDGSWLGGVIIEGVYGIHVEAYGAEIILNVNNTNCRAVDVYTVRDFTWDGGIISTNYQGVGTLFALHGQNLRNNGISNLQLGTLAEGGLPLPWAGGAIGFDNGGTDNGSTIDVQTFTNLQFHGNTNDLIQRGTNMTDQIYIGADRYDYGLTVAGTAFEIANGSATFIHPYCGVFTGNGVGGTCFKLDADAWNVDIFDVYAEISESAQPWLVDSSTFFGAQFYGGQINDFTSTGTSGSPVLWADLSGNQSNGGTGGYTLFNTIQLGAGGYKAIKLPYLTTFGVTLKNPNFGAGVHLTNAYLGPDTGRAGDWKGAQATINGIWMPSTVQPYVQVNSGLHPVLATSVPGTGAVPITGPATGVSGNCVKQVNGSFTLADAGAPCGGGTRAATQKNVSAPAGPANTGSYTMQGLAGTITPAVSGNILITISGDIYGSTLTAAGDGINFAIAYGTGGAPTNGAASTGTLPTNGVQYSNPTTVTSTDVHVPFSTSAVVSGLTLGTAYWVDLEAQAVGAAGFTLNNVSVSIIEN